LLFLSTVIAANGVIEVGRKGRSPSVLKSFRFKHEDVLRLSRLRRNLPARSDTEVIRMALELLESSFNPASVA
jgi:hypothetical protein